MNQATDPLIENSPVANDPETQLRQAFLDATDAERPAALERLHRRLAEMQPYRVLGQYDQEFLQLRHGVARAVVHVNEVLGLVER